MIHHANKVLKEFADELIRDLYSIAWNEEREASENYMEFDEFCKKHKCHTREH